MKAAVVGSGGWGTALALRLLYNGHDTLLWSHDPQKAERMTVSRENNRLPGVPLPPELEITAREEQLSDRELVIIASPSFPLRQICARIAPYLREDAVLISVTKGIEPGTLLRMSQVVEQETHHPVTALTGPSHAEEVARGIPTGCLAASAHRELAEFAQDALMSDAFRIYTSPDIVGAELGGALKNVIALCAGVSDGLGYGDNTKAMLMTRGLTEIARLGVSMGASRETFAGLAGVGDLIVTCTSMHSRNRRCGILIGQGKDVQEAIKEVGATVEGYFAALSAHQLSQKAGVEMPICESAYRVLYEGQPVGSVLEQLMNRNKRREADESWI